MDLKSQVREKLRAAYQRLAPFEKALMQLCSVIYEPTDPVALFKCFRRTGLIFPGGNITGAADLASPITRLRALKLLNNHLQCHEAIVEVCSRDSLNTALDPVHGPEPEIVAPAPKSGKQRPPKPSKARPRAIFSPPPGNRYQLMARAVQLETPPVGWHSKGAATAYCQRAMRNLRIGLYTENTQLLYKSYQQLLSYCPTMYGHPGPLVRICTNPFDAAWFRTLSAVSQTEVLTEIFYHTLFSLDADDEALAYALDPSIRKAIALKKNPGFCHHLISRLLIGGRLTEAEILLEEMSETVLLYGLEGWILFLNGHLEAAIDSFESDLKKLRRNLGKRTAFFGGLEGLFFILAQLQSAAFRDTETDRHFA